MTEIREWLRVNDNLVVELADQLEVPEDLVHLTVVLIMGGLSDVEIHDQIDDLRQTGRAAPPVIDALHRGLPAIRAAATAR